MSRDPVCRMDVDEDQALKHHLFAQYDGSTFYFCSEECKDQFDRSPPLYTALVAAWSPDQQQGQSHLHP